MSAPQLRTNNIVRSLHGAAEKPILSEDSGGPGDMVSGERMAKLEGAMDGLKVSMEGLRHSQNLTVAAVGIVGALLFGLNIYMLQRIDSLPGEFQEMNRTLSQAITAAKQIPSQVILVPAPSAPQIAPPAK